MNSVEEYVEIVNKNYHYKKYSFSKRNLNKILSVLHCAINDYNRVFAFRCDLRFPVEKITLGDELLTTQRKLNGSNLMKRFIEEFKKLIRKDMAEKCRAGKRYHETKVRYFWAREQELECPYPHFHLMIILNRDAYARVGRYDSPRMNVANKVRVAWRRAISDDEEREYNGLVSFPKNSEYSLTRRDMSSMNDFLIRSAYLAKNETKNRGHETRCFGGSNI